MIRFNQSTNQSTFIAIKNKHKAVEYRDLKRYNRIQITYKFKKI